MEIGTSWSKALEIGDSWFKDFCVYAHISVYKTSNKNIDFGPNVEILLAFDIDDQRLWDMTYLCMVKCQIYKSITNDWY